MKKRMQETEEGRTIFNFDPLISIDHYEINYLHSYAQDSPFFVGLAKGKLQGSACTKCNYKYATPRAVCMYCGEKTEWFTLPEKGKIHTWTTCHYGSEAFLKETPYHLIMVEFPEVDTLFFSRFFGEGKELAIGKEVLARFRRNSKFSITDVYFVLP
ncbi:MAG: Zn-ribbon domain-containing OB-fold protein [Nitrospinota bacterium]